MKSNISKTMVVMYHVTVKLEEASLSPESDPKLEKPSNSSRNNFGKITKKELVMTLINRELLSSSLAQ